MKRLTVIDVIRVVQERKEKIEHMTKGERENSENAYPTVVMV